MDAMLKNGVFAPRSSNFWQAVSAGISGLAGLAGNAMNAKAMKQYNKGQMEIAQMSNEWNANEALKNREWQESMVDKQNNWNLEQWNRENEYNAASAQRQRLEDAGLNPYMMMNGGSAGSAGSVSSASPSGGSQSAPAQMPNQQALRYDFTGIADSINSYFQNKKLTAETRDVNAMAGLHSDPNWQYGQIVSAVNGDMYKLSPDYAAYQRDNAIQFAQLGLRQYSAQAYGVEIQNQLAVAQKLKVEEEGKQVALMNKWFDTRQNAELMAIAAEIGVSVSTGQLNYEKAKNAYYERVKMAAETEGIKVNNRILRETADARIEEAIEIARNSSIQARADRPFIPGYSVRSNNLAKAMYDLDMENIEKQDRGWNRFWRYDWDPAAAGIGRILGGAGILLTPGSLNFRKPRKIGY